MTLTKEQRRACQLELKQALQQVGQLVKNQHDVRVQFFGVADPNRAKLHDKCCKLFRGMNPPQKVFFDALRNPKYKVFAMVGGNQIGKTTSLCVLGTSYMMGHWPWDGEKIKFSHGGPRKVRYIGSDWSKHIEDVVVPTLKYWWPKNRKLKTSKNHMGVESMWLDEETGSTLEIMSNLQGSDLHEGWIGDLVLYDEPCRREIRVANSRGLIARRGIEAFGMTLLSEAWIDKEILKATLPDGTPDPEVFSVVGTMYDNLGFGLDAEGIERFAKNLTDDEKQARLYGKPAHLAGLIYPKFNRITHVRKLDKVPLDWVVDISIDFHPSKPWAILFMATDKRGFKWVIDEIYQHGSWKVLGDEVVRRCRDFQYRVGTIVIDPLSKGDEQSDLHEESVFVKMQNHFAAFGYDMYAASKDKSGGIHLVSDLLLTENEIPALFFRNTCKRTISEVENYMIDKATGLPQKYDDDFPECLYRLVLLNTEWTAPTSSVPVMISQYQNSEAWT